MEHTLVLLTNRSLRQIRAEIDFLTESSILTPAQQSSLLAILPSPQTNYSSTPHTSSLTPSLATTALHQSQHQQPPSSLNEKQPHQQDPTSYYAPNPTPSQSSTPAPPAYNHSNPPPQPLPVLATTSALFFYNPTDAGDLGLAPNDRVFVTEYMNDDWAKGRNERTGQEGIFPRSYVRVEHDGPPPQQQGGGGSQGPMGYGNLPLAVSQGQQQPGGTGDVNAPGGQQGPPSKLEAGGKKFGKKLGNAAIFGAGATIGSNIVNGIF
ncbi:hypothetical protein MMC25_001351 [Agyrium rufum]|nr:hypothetical protein [Agyrium rufum]